MALVSPGVQVTIIDESNYLSAATNSVPYFLIATAQDKVSGSGVGVAAGTLAANANRAYLITSQRDLTATFGNPFFYKTTIGTPINGYELNEYGLLAAYSALGVTNRAYVQRCDIDLTQLTASLVRPTGEPDNGTYWLDTANTLWGIFEWNLTTGTFSNMVPSVITDSAYLLSGVPVDSYGSIGDYAVVATNTANPIYYKNGAVPVANGNSTTLSDLYNTWVLVGSNDWKLSYPTAIGANSVDNLPAGSIVINGSSPIAVPGSPNDDVVGLSNAINTAAITGVYSAVIDGKLCLYANADANADGSTANDGIIVIGDTSTPALITALGLTTGIAYYAPTLQQSPSYQNPRWNSTSDEPRPTGSVWNKTNSVNLGTTMVVKKYSTALAAFVQQSATVYANDWTANATLDASGGGKTIPVGTTYTQYNVSPEENNVDTGINYPFNPTYTLQVFERSALGATVITGDNNASTFGIGDQFYIMTSTANSTTLTTPVLATLNGTTPADFVQAVSAANVPNVVASVNSNGYIVLTQTQGGVILLQDVTSTPVANAGFSTAVTGCRNVYLNTDTTDPITVAEDTWLSLSNWIAATYTASAVAPNQDPANGRYWYYSATNQVDIMVQSGTGWVGYRNETNDIRGYNLSLTNTAGPQISATAPTTQSDGTTALAYGDLWIDTSNLELYPVINRWSVVDGVDQWVTLDNTDQTTQNGVLFADARWSSTGTVNPITDPLPTITSLNYGPGANYLDIDAPDYNLYPTGMLLFNTRRSGFNVKSFQANYFNATSFSYPTWSNSTTYAIGDQVLYSTVLYVAIATPPTGTVPTNTSYWSELQVNSWVTASGNRNSGAPNMGRFAQRELIVAALKSGIDTSVTIREEQVQFNLSACTAYPELIPNMLALSNERNNTVFVVGDTPMRLPASAADIVSWATDNAGAGYPTGDGLTTNLPHALKC